MCVVRWLGLKCKKPRTMARLKCCVVAGADLRLVRLYPTLVVQRISLRIHHNGKPTLPNT